MIGEHVSMPIATYKGKSLLEVNRASYAKPGKTIRSQREFVIAGFNSSPVGTPQELHEHLKLLTGLDGILFIDQVDDEVYIQYADGTQELDVDINAVEQK